MRWDWKALLGVMLAAVAAGWFFTRTVHEPLVDFEAIDRDLTDLAGALRATNAAEGELVARVSAGISFPTTMQYRRPSDFWRPAMGTVTRTRRVGRKAGRTPAAGQPGAQSGGQ